jgi:hypothetical protein
MEYPMIPKYQYQTRFAKLKMTSNPQPQTSMSSPLIWFLLVDSATGDPYKGTTVSSVVRSTLVVPMVAAFRSAVKKKYSTNLSFVDTGDLLVYKNKAAFDRRNATFDEGKEEPLEEDSVLTDLGKSETEALVVIVPVSDLANVPFTSIPIDCTSLELNSVPEISTIS